MILRLTTLTLICIACSQVVAQSQWTFDPSADEFKEDAWLDLSYLNEEEAGQSGFIGLSNDGNSFVDGNGDPVRFWSSGGAGLSANLSDSELEYFAKFLAKKGVNIIRFHAEISPSGDDFNTPNMGEIDEIWRAVAAFKAEGIYMVISPHWPYHIENPPASWGFGEYTGNSSSAKPWGTIYFYDTYQEAYKNWVNVLYAEVNPYTSIPLKDDPSIALIQTLNEDGIFFWTSQGLSDWPDMMAVLEGKFYDFLIDKYTTIDDAYTAWNDDTNANDDLQNQRMGIEIIYYATLPEGHGDLGGVSQARLSDQIQFMAELQEGFYSEIYDHYKNVIGCQQLINTTNWRTASSLRLYDAERWTNTAADVIAVNRYVDPGHSNPNNPGYAGYRIDPGDHFVGESVLVNPNRLPINNKQVAGHPFIITESGWNLPNKYQAEGPWLIAAYSSLVGTDGYFWFSPSHQGYDDNPYYDFWNDYPELDTYPMFRWTSSIPGMTAMYPANAYIFRKGLLAEGDVMVHEERPLQDIWDRKVPVIAEENGFDPNRDTFGDEEDPSETEVIPFAFLTGRIESAYGQGGNTTISPQINTLVDLGNKTIESSTGELHWDYGNGICTMTADKAQGAVGFFSDDESTTTIELPDVTLRVRNNYAAISVVSLDDQPISTSGEVLVQVGTVYRPTNWREEPLDNDEGFEILNTGKMPWKAVNTMVSMEVRNTNIKSAHAININGEKVGDLVLFETEAGVEIFLPNNAMYVVLNTTPAVVSGTGKLNKSWELYPNPSSGVFTVKLSNEIKGQVNHLQLIDLMGREMMETEIKNNQFQVERSGINPGVYVLMLKDNEKVVDRRKLIIE